MKATIHIISTCLLCLATTMMLTGCWESDTQFITAADAVHPLRHGDYIAVTRINSDTSDSSTVLLAKAPSSNVLLVYNKRTVSYRFKKIIHPRLPDTHEYFIIGTISDAGIYQYFFGVTDGKALYVYGAPEPSAARVTSETELIERMITAFSSASTPTFIYVKPVTMDAGTAAKFAQQHKDVLTTY